MNTARPTSDEVAQWIVNYLDRHPRAADTSLGIQRWWLAPRFGEVPLDLVEEALMQLEGKGVVSRIDPSASEPSYGRGPSFAP